MNSIKIKPGKRGYHLMINGMYISQAFGDDIKAIKNDLGIPCGATEWVSIPAIRKFWKQYRMHAIDATRCPYVSINGNLVKTLSGAKRKRLEARIQDAYDQVNWYGWGCKGGTTYKKLQAKYALHTGSIFKPIYTCPA